MLHLCSRFLTDDAEYAQAEDFWARLWEEIPNHLRRNGQWRRGWFQPQALKDGNPIFTAVSEMQSKAIRVIQYEPTSQDAEIDFWFDTFGGEVREPKTIRELVIACALSTETAETARKLMSSWISGSEASLEQTADLSADRPASDG